MSAYWLLKNVHVTTAIITAALFATRVGLDLASRPGWRKTSLRYIPHINDTLLLAAAVGLCVVTGWYPFVRGWDWLTVKVILLCVYIACGKMTLDQQAPREQRIGAGAAALLVLVAIFAHALYKPY